MKSIKDTASFFGTNRYRGRFETLHIDKQLVVLLDEFGKTHLYKAKLIGDLTKKHRASFAFQLVKDLHEAGYVISNVLNFRQEHVKVVVDIWKSRNYAAATIQSNFSHLKWLTIAIGKRGLIQDTTYYGLSKLETSRCTAAKYDKSWSANGLSATDLIAAVADYDPMIGMNIEAMHLFGLRVRESMLLRPLVSDRDASLIVEAGTKGGRTRIVEITSLEQRAFLERAKIIAKATDRGSLISAGMTPAQARNRLYYILGKVGITKKQLNITAYGLRHQFANDLFEEVGSVPSPVRGGPHNPNQCVDMAARTAVSNALGHARLHITTAYTGARKLGRPKGKSSPTDTPGI